MKNDFYSPLRYPGGKGCIAPFLADVIKLNHLERTVYYELYAGGAGAALTLLMNNLVKRIVINDADTRIYAFWHSVLYETKKICRLIDKTEVTVTEWQHQKDVYSDQNEKNLLKIGFATFFLNRTNRSGIIHKAGPIGGLKQDGNYLIDVRFHKENLKKRIKLIAAHAKQITLLNLTTEDFLAKEKLYKSHLEHSLFYLDPPYYYKGQELYLNNYVHDQHQHLANLMEQSIIPHWLMSYDNVIEIRKMYKKHRQCSFNLNYSLNEKRPGSELMIFSPRLLVPSTITIRSKRAHLAVH